MAPNYRLVYFGVRGIAEPIRLIFAYKGVEYEDVRIEWQDWVEKKKDESPFGKLPYLEFDGKVLCQSLAIQRYLAKKFGLLGKDDWEAAQCDMLAETMYDLRMLFSHYWAAVDEKMKEEKKKIFCDTAPFYLDKFENVLRANNGGKGFLVGDSVTWVDFLFLSMLEMFMEQIDSKLLDSRPLLHGHKMRVENIPGVKTWIDQRPKTFI